MNKLEFNSNDYKISVIGITLKYDDYIVLNTNSEVLQDLFTDLYIDAKNVQYKTEVYTGDKFVFINIYEYSPKMNDWLDYAQKIINIDQISQIEVYHTEETQ